MQCCEKLKSINQDGRIGLLQDFVSKFRLSRDSLRKFIDSTTSISTTLELRRNGVEMLKYEILMTTEFLLGNGSSPNIEDFKKLVKFDFTQFQQMNSNIDTVMRKYQPASKRMIKTVNGFKEESCFDDEFVIPEEIDYLSLQLEHVEDCQVFRAYYLGQAYQTFVGTLEKYGRVIISVKKEETERNGERDMMFTIIFRSKELATARQEVVFGSQLKKSFLSRKPTEKQALQLLDREVNFAKLRALDPEPHLEAKILNLDEFKVLVLF
jgi:hypothetical protein